MTLRIHFIIHEDYELPGAYEIWAIKHGYKVVYSRIYAGDPLPQAIDEIDMLIVMGGPQSPLTTKAECSYFDSNAEQKLIKLAKESSKMVIGVCLGAQLIGQALGGMVERSPEKEIGVYPIYLTDKGEDNPFIKHFGHELMVGHWHGDMPGLTAEAQILAYSAGCPRQIISFGPWVYGFQCHMEFTPELNELLIGHSEIDLANANDFAYVQTAKQIRNQNYELMNQMLYVFLDKITDHYQHHLN